MSERVWDEDPTIPPPGRRNGTGSSSILPYLARSLAAKPQGDPPGRLAEGARVDIELELEAELHPVAVARAR